MIVDLHRADPPPPRSGEVVVVGAGAAGLALALALEERGVPVLLLESGGGTAAPDGADPLNVGEVVGQAYRGLTGARARGLGGATALWHGQCTRLHPEDLAARSWVPGSGWPLDPAELDAWYVHAERWFGLSGRGYGADRWREHPGLTPVAWTPGRLEHDFTEYAPVIHQGSRHRAHLERSGLVTVLEHATVAAVRLEGARAVGVEVAPTRERRVALPAAAVVLAAGAVENARVLLLSDPAGTGLGTGRAHTGRWLQDHPVIRTAQVVARDPRWLQDRSSPLYAQGRRVYPKVRLAPAAQREHRLLDATAVLAHEHAGDHAGRTAARRLLDGARRRELPPDALREGLAAVRAAPSIGRDVWRRYGRGLSTGQAASGVFVEVWLEQQPDADSRVTLSSSTDPLGLPQARVQWRTSEAEVRTSRAMTRWIAEDLDRAGVAEVRELAPMTDDDAWRASVGDAWHPSGTTRMSEAAGEGVVDPHGRVHGVEGLHVAGASTFPVAGYANPTLTIVALSLRLAAHLSSVGVR